MDEKTYEELIGEALSLIPVYSKEWTNYNQSDPGITILQNFAAFQYLQQESILEITEEVTRGLLKLAGIEPSPEAGSRLILEAGQAAGKAFSLPGHTKMYAGDICFETVRTEHIPSKRLKRIFLEKDGDLKEVTDFLPHQAAAGVPIFGNPAKTGRGIWLEFSSLPEPGGQLELYCDVTDEMGRNPFEAENVLRFAGISWQCHTQSGWEEMEAEDETRYFLKSGRVRFRMPKEPAAIPPGKDGYMIRCRLRDSDYDNPPGLRTICEPVIEVVQRETLAASFFFDGEDAAKNGNRVEVFDGLTDSGCYEVFIEDESAGGYIRFERSSGIDRSYREVVRENGRLILEFGDDRRLIRGGSRAVAVVCYDEAAILNRQIGQIFGYDNQMMELEQIDHVISEGFCVLAELKGRAGETVYRFVRPGSIREDEPVYELLEVEGKLRVTDPGFARKCRLLLCDCAVTRGEKGRVRRGSILNAGGYVMTAAAPSVGGSSRETVEVLKERLTERASKSAVTVSDYERIVRETPGLVVDKVKAWMDSGHNRVCIAVKPGGGRRAGLSGLYEKAILNHLERHRLITVSVRVMGTRWTPVRISGRVCVKSPYDGAPDTVRTLIADLFSGLADQAGFGGTIELSRIFKAVQELGCVAEVYELAGHPGAGASVYGSDIVMENDCLAFLDKIEISFTQNRMTDGREGAVWRFH